MPQKSILVVGSLNMDQIVQVPRIPTLGETLLGAGSLKLVPGGKGANQAVAIARLGATVSMAGRIGADPFGSQMLQSLQNELVDTSLIVTDQQEASGVAFIFLSSGNNAIVVAPGANMRLGLDPQHYTRIVAKLKQVDALVLQLEIPLATVCLLIQDAHNAGVEVILNLAPAQQLPQHTLKQLSLLVLNEHEASLLSGQRVETLEDATIVATVLHEYGIPTVIITLGSRGALLVTKDDTGKTQTLYQTAPNVDVVDTTAAGDCFVGALTVARTEGRTPAETLRFAVYASAQKVTRFGAQSGLPYRQHVQDLYDQQPPHLSTASPEPTQQTNF